MNVIFLFPYPLGQAPSQRFRFEQYLDRLEPNGITYTGQSFWSAQTWGILYKKGHYFAKTIGFLSGVIRRFGVLAKAHRADLIFIHRECMPIGPPLIEWMLARVWRKRLVYDFDDAIWLSNTSTENKLVAFFKWHKKVKSICRWSYKVSCGNQFLHDFAINHSSHVIIIPTTIETEFWHNPALHSTIKSVDNVIIGWTGTHSTIKYLNLIIDILQKIEIEHKNVTFLIIADKEPKLPLERARFIPWSKEQEIEDLIQFDIGVMPLTDDIWAKGKCGFKALQYLSLNIPALVSPVGVNSEVVENNVNGFLCSTSSEWYNNLKLLIIDSKIRHEMGIRGRKKIIENYSVSSNASVFLSLFE